MRNRGPRGAIASLVAAAGLCLAAGSSNAPGAERQREWWAHTRQVLFTDVELSAEQARRVDRIIDAQLATRVRLQELDTELGAARRRGDAERSAALRAQRPAIQALLKDPYDLIEEMRTLLAEGQRPAFDMNRARLLAEGQRPREPRRGEAERPETDAKGQGE